MTFLGMTYSYVQYENIGCISFNLLLYLHTKESSFISLRVTATAILSTMLLVHFFIDGRVRKVRLFRKATPNAKRGKEN